MIFICEILFFFVFTALTCGIFDICAAGDTPDQIPLPKKSVSFSEANISLLAVQKQFSPPTKAAKKIEESRERTKESAARRKAKEAAKKQAAENAEQLFARMAQN